MSADTITTGNITFEEIKPHHGGRYNLITAQQQAVSNSVNIWSMATAIFEQINAYHTYMREQGQKLVVALGEQHDIIEDAAIQIALLAMLAQQRDTSNGPAFSTFIETDHTAFDTYGSAKHFSPHGQDLRIAPFIGHILPGKNAHLPIATAALYTQALKDDIPLIPVDAKRFYAAKNTNNTEDIYIDITDKGDEHSFMHHVRLERPHTSYPRLTNRHTPSFQATSPEGMALRNLVMSERILKEMDTKHLSLGILITGAAHIAGGQSLAAKLGLNKGSTPFHHSLIDIFNRMDNNYSLLPITPKSGLINIKLDNGQTTREPSYTYSDNINTSSPPVLLYDTVSRFAQDTHTIESNTLKALTKAFPHYARPCCPTSAAMDNIDFNRETAVQIENEACRILNSQDSPDAIYQQIKESTCRSFEKARFTPFEP